MYLLALLFFLGQNTNDYLGPTEKSREKLIRVQVIINDDPNPNGVTIGKASFAGTDIPLKPRGDIHGFRGQASFQKKAGKYVLKWTVDKNTQEWPRTVDHEEEVTLDPRDLWLQITITGENAQIS